MSTTATNKTLALRSSLPRMVISELKQFATVGA